MSEHDKKLRPHVYAAAQKMFDGVDECHKQDIASAIDWARETLTNHEGAGHSFYIVAGDNGLFCCCFAKPQWNADHCSQGMDESHEAIVMAVCEYLSGV